MLCYLFPDNLDQICSGTVVIEVDEAVLLQFSDDYYGDTTLDCRVTFYTTNIMTVDIRELDIESHFNCSDEWIELHDGFATISPILTS